MKTGLRFEPYRIRGHKVGKSSWYPAIRELIKSEISAELDEDDGLFIGYGMMPDGLPYTMQDQYDTPEEELTFQSAILENDYLNDEINTGHTVISVGAVVLVKRMEIVIL